MNYFKVTTVVGCCAHCPHQVTPNEGLRHCKLIDDDSAKSIQVVQQNEAKLTDTCPMWPEVDFLTVNELQPAGPVKSVAGGRALARALLARILPDSSVRRA